VFTSAVSAVLLVAFVSFAVWSNFTKRTKIEQAFAATETGRPKKELIKELGAPDEIEFCRKPDVGPLERSCEEKYWYKVFIARWGFTFDKNGAVIHKAHNVSY